MDNITFEALLSAVGAGIAATIVTLTVDLFKTAFQKFGGQDWDGMMLAFIFSAVLYVLAGVATGTDTLNEGLAVFLSWLTCAAAAVGVHKAIVNPIVEAAGGNT